jgi:hypothetical protein
MLRRQIKKGFDDIAVDDKIRAIVARNWPHLLSKPQKGKTDAARKPQPTTWTVHKIAAKQTRLGEVEAEAADEREATERAG